jgi:hypothetical protein
MDINPEDFQTSFEDYEFASYCASHSVDVILFSSAWLMQDDIFLSLDQYWQVSLGKPILVNS